MDVITFTLCKEHDVYFTQACPGCYFEHVRREERYTGRPAQFTLHEIAQLAATSTPWPMVP